MNLPNREFYKIPIESIESEYNDLIHFGNDCDHIQIIDYILTKAKDKNLKSVRLKPETLKKLISFPQSALSMELQLLERFNGEYVNPDKVPNLGSHNASETPREDFLKKADDLPTPTKKKALDFEISINWKAKDKSLEFIHPKNFKKEKFSSIENLSDAIGNGHSFTSVFLPGTRTKESFQYSQFLALDFDSGYSLEDALLNQYIKNESALIYTTPSHTPESHRFRVVFIFPYKIFKTDYKLILLNAEKLFPNADKQCFDESKQFNGNTKSEFPLIENRYISNDFLNQLLKEKHEIQFISIRESKKNQEKTEKKNPDADESNNDKYDYNDIEKTKERVRILLSNIPHKTKDREYNEYSKLILSLKELFSDAEIKSMASHLFTKSNVEIKNILNQYKPGKLSISSFFYLSKNYFNIKIKGINS